MIFLKKTVLALNSSALQKTAKDEITLINKSLLPLQKGLSLSSYLGNTPFSVVILKIVVGNDNINIKAGIFYTGIIAGCSCSDDPTPTDEQNEYCELQFTTNIQTAETSVKLLDN